MHQAKVIMHKDNASIFEALENGAGDVMITDLHEVQWQSGLRQGLCGTMDGGAFNRYEKAYLLPRDLIWKAYVDTWLEMRLLDGTVDSVFTQYLH